ncbi:hypothetical protein ACPOL_3311 [Acidisarcina polymorpha]|uniref:Uncharacterized protein n=1 Tax=Acidisarcina polymorpha TaxID=2211140 RepID=A0A2Z5G0H6_9BACT|nr:hypothetical protein ACPOL_3311 [Acidisarcina polymorpha]
MLSYLGVNGEPVGIAQRSSNLSGFVVGDSFLAHFYIPQPAGFSNK